jgi:hypothetical protein
MKIIFVGLKLAMSVKVRCTMKILVKVFLFISIFCQATFANDLYNATVSDLKIPIQISFTSEPVLRQNDTDRTRYSTTFEWYREVKGYSSFPNTSPAAIRCEILKSDAYSELVILRSYNKPWTIKLTHQFNESIETSGISRNFSPFDSEIQKYLIDLTKSDENTHNYAAGFQLSHPAYGMTTKIWCTGNCGSDCDSLIIKLLAQRAGLK